MGIYLQVVTTCIQNRARTHNYCGGNFCFSWIFFAKEFRPPPLPSATLAIRPRDAFFRRFPYYRRRFEPENRRYHVVVAGHHRHYTSDCSASSSAIIERKTKEWEREREVGRQLLYSTLTPISTCCYFPSKRAPPHTDKSSSSSKSSPLVIFAMDRELERQLKCVDLYCSGIAVNATKIKNQVLKSSPFLRGKKCAFLFSFELEKPGTTHKQSAVNLELLDYHASKITILLHAEESTSSSELLLKVLCFVERLFYFALSLISRGRTPSKFRGRKRDILRTSFRSRAHVWSLCVCETFRHTFAEISAIQLFATSEIWGHVHKMVKLTT